MNGSLVAGDTAMVAWVLAGAVAVLALLLILAVRGLLRQRAQLARHKEITDSEGQKRVEKSRSVILGQVAEHFAPLPPGFAYNPKDARFLGQPVDYLVFNGLNDARPGSADLEIVLVEIKSGGSHLSAAEKAIRAAVEVGRVRFEVWRLGADGAINVEEKVRR